jgi:hypothetical protein
MTNIISPTIFFFMISIRRCIQKFPDWFDKEIYAYNSRQLLRSNTKGYGDKTQ